MIVLLKKLKEKKVEGEELKKRASKRAMNLKIDGVKNMF